MDTRHYKSYIQIGLNILHYRKERGHHPEQTGRADLLQSQPYSEN